MGKAKENEGIRDLTQGNGIVLRHYLTMLEFLKEKPLDGSFENINRRALQCLNDNSERFFDYLHHLVNEEGAANLRNVADALLVFHGYRWGGMNFPYHIYKFIEQRLESNGLIMITLEKAIQECYKDILFTLSGGDKRTKLVYQQTAGLLDYIGKNTKREVKVRIDVSDMFDN